MAQLQIERVCFWLSRLGFGVAWSQCYDQLLVRLFSEGFPDVSVAARQTELTRLRSHLINFCRPASGAQSGPTPFDAPTGIACIRLILIAEPNICSGFQPSWESSIPSAHGAAIQFSTNGVLEYLDGV